MTKPDKTDGRARFDAAGRNSDSARLTRVDHDDLQRTAERTYNHGDALAPDARAALEAVARLDGIEISPDDHDVYLAGVVLGSWRRQARRDATSPARDREHSARQAMRLDSTQAWQFDQHGNRKRGK